MNWWERFCNWWYQFWDMADASTIGKDGFFAVMFIILRDLWNKLAWYWENYTLGCIVVLFIISIIIYIILVMFDLDRVIRRKLIQARWRKKLRGEKNG